MKSQPCAPVFDHQYASLPPKGNLSDHTYSVNPCAALPASDSSASLESDPNGWLNSTIEVCEVVKMVKLLKNGRTMGCDNLPNEAI